MACAAVIARNNIANDAGFDKNVQKAATQQGINCITSYGVQGQCSKYCTNSNKDINSCMQCLSNVALCAIDTSPALKNNPANACCPFSVDSVACTNCMMNNNQTASNCATASGISWALVGSLIGVGAAILIIGLTVGIIYWKRRKSTKDTSELFKKIAAKSGRPLTDAQKQLIINTSDTSALQNYASTASSESSIYV